MHYEFTFTAGAPAPIACRSRVHGRHCEVPWGWDRDHTDSDRPYTLAELVEREENPHFYAYPTAQEYEQGWYLWRALKRDARLSKAEADARFQVIEERINERVRQIG